MVPRIWLQCMLRMRFRAQSARDGVDKKPFALRALARVTLVRSRHITFPDREDHQSCPDSSVRAPRARAVSSDPPTQKLQ